MHEVEKLTMKKEILSSTAKKRKRKERKNETSLGIDGIQNYWWKELKSEQRTLVRAYDAMKEDNNVILPVVASRMHSFVTKK